MAKITYNGESDQVSWRGVGFLRGEPVSVDNADLIKAAGKNPMFEVTDAVDADADDEGKGKGKGLTAEDRGVKAATEGKERTVPPAYRGKPAEAEWLAGFDSVKPD